MKRAPELRALSEDHHHGLVLARKAKLAGTDPGAAIDATWAEVEAKFEAELEPHFQIEEELLAPPLAAIGEQALVGRLFVEHAALRACVAAGAPRTREALAGFGDLLEAHIRFEERELFETAQTRLDAGALRAIAEAG